MNKIRLVSWDVDGTLFSFASLLKQLLLKADCRQLWQLVKFHRTVEKQRRGSDCCVMLTPEFRQTQENEKAILKELLPQIPPRREAIKLIEQFSQSRVIQVALSDFESDYKLKALGISSYFAKSYSCQQIGFWKPSPIPLAKIQHDFGIAPQDHLHIGDRIDADGQACIRNGCHFLRI